VGRRRLRRLGRSRLRRQSVCWTVWHWQRLGLWYSWRIWSTVKGYCSSYPKHLYHRKTPKCILSVPHLSSVLPSGGCVNPSSLVFIARFPSSRNTRCNAVTVICRDTPSGIHSRSWVTKRTSEPVVRECSTGTNKRRTRHQVAILVKRDPHERGDVYQLQESRQNSAVHVAYNLLLRLRFGRES